MEQHAQTQPKIAKVETYTPYVPRGLQIIRTECEGTDITHADVLGICRANRIVEIRNRISKRLFTELHWGLSRIARYLHKDHSTIWYAIRRPRRELADLPAIYGRGKQATVIVTPVAKPYVPPEPKEELTPEQLACRAATDNLVTVLTGRRGFSGVRVKDQIRRLPFEEIVK